MLVWLFPSKPPPPSPININTSYLMVYSDRALFVFLLRNFIIKNTNPYDVIQNSAVIPVCSELAFGFIFDQGSTHISPRIVLLLQVEGLRIVRTHRVLAERASAGGIRVQEVTSLLGDELGHVLAACLSGRGVELDILRRLTLHLDIPEHLAQKTTHQVGERVKVVHPVPPEGRNTIVGHNNTTESDHTRTDEDGVHDGGKVLVGCVCRNGLSDRCIQEFVD